MNRPYLETQDFAVSKEKFVLQKHSKWDILMTHPLPKNLDSYYESEDYISHTDAKQTATDKAYQWVKQRNLKRKWKLVKQFAGNTKTVLDIGAGTGDFVRMGKTLGWDVQGMEPNAGARERAAKKGVDMVSSLDDLPETSFTVITLWHVLEHLYDFKGKVEEFNDLLNKEGLLVLALPNHESWDASFLGKDWAAYDTPRHLWHFTPKVIQDIASANKFELVKFYPMPFDAFYVSMLS